MGGITSLMNTGRSALMANQGAINVVGNNISHVNTEGYSRQVARFNDIYVQTFNAGQLGLGVEVDIERCFNRFVENAYLDKFSEYSRWNEEYGVLQSVESLFNEANTDGISSALGVFFQDWNNLVQLPDDTAAREALLEDAQSLITLINHAQTSLDTLQEEMNAYIADAVGEVNRLLQQIQGVSRQIAEMEPADISNVNALKDERDLLVRQLAEYIEVDVHEDVDNDFRLTTVDGMPLMDLMELYSLEVRGPRIENNLKPDSAYGGTIEVSGNDGHEYVFEVLKAPIDANNPGEMRVSVDGGRTWLRNADGTEMRVDIPADYGDPAHPIRVKDMELVFTANPANLAVGDRFEVVPKEGLYWVSPTRDALNITPQVLANDKDNSERLTEGKLAAYYTVRDHHIARYEDKLNAFAETLIWEVNNIHAQGSGMEAMTHTIGSYEIPIDRRHLPLGDGGCGLPFSDRLTEGNVTFQLYDEVTGQPAGGMWELDFKEDDSNDLTSQGIQNFNPDEHKLEDVREALNRAYNKAAKANGITSTHEFATIVDNRLQLTAGPEFSFAVGNDTSGLMAALGLNTFFTGGNAGDMGLNAAVVQNSDFINAGKINANSAVNPGDNAVALDMVKLATKTVDFSTTWSHAHQTLGNYYGTLVGLVGSEVRTVATNADYTEALANDLQEKTQAISGVNLDEEMTLLIKFQHSYTAAAKLITTADEMLQTLLSLKQ